MTMLNRQWLLWGDQLMSAKRTENLKTPTFFNAKPLKFARQWLKRAWIKSLGPFSVKHQRTCLDTFPYTNLHVGSQTLNCQITAFSKRNLLLGLIDSIAGFLVITYVIFVGFSDMKIKFKVYVWNLSVK